jgi:hypothetical protein
VGNLIESLSNREITIAVHNFCKARGLEPVNVRAKSTLLGTAIREYYQMLRYSDRRPIGPALTVESLVDMMDKATA